MTRAALFGAALLLAGCSEQSVELFDASGGGTDGSIDDRDRDPEACGPLSIHCEDDEYCVAGACICRPPLTLVGEDCVDLQSDAENCGAPGVVCALCVDGACGATCDGGRVDCEGDCVDTSSHPSNCGDCGRPCGANQVCIDGVCQEFSPAPCTSCPCGCARACCTYPGFPTDAICLTNADSC